VFVAWRDLRRSWRRFVLVGVVVVLVAFLSTVLTGLADGLVSAGTSGLRALPLTHLAFSPGAQSVFSRSTLDQRNLDAWRGVPGVEASPVGVSFVNAASTDGGPKIDLALFGVTADSFLVERPEGRAALAGGPGLVLSSDLEDKGVHVGDTFAVGGSDQVLPVLGFTYAGSYGHVPIAYTSLPTWQSVTYGNDSRGRFSAIALQVPRGTDLAASDAAAGTETMTKAQAYEGSPGFVAETATMSLIRGFLLVISALIVGAFFTVLTVQRTRHIGLLKAMGASNRQVLVDGVGQMTVVVLAATALGVALGVGGAAAMARGSAPIELAAPAVLGTALLIVLTGVLGAIVPFRRITNVDPAIALGVEV
jgi:putative ABC transport system permease protein